MTRRMTLAIFLMIFCATLAWPKWKEEEQQYLDTQFRNLQEQGQALSTQVQALNAHLTELRQNQAQLQAVIIRQQRALQDMEQLVSSMRINGEENYSTLKSALAQLRTETQKSFADLTGKAAAQQTAATVEAGPAPRAPVAPTGPPVVLGYVTVVEGSNLMVDLGSAQGVRAGSRLALYKAADPNTRAGVLEVTQAVDAGNSRARIVTMNSGVQPEFGDIVRLE